MLQINARVCLSRKSRWRTYTVGTEVPIYNVPRHRISVSVLLYDVLALLKSQLCFYEAVIVSESTASSSLTVHTIAVDCRLVYTGDGNLHLSAVAGR